MRLLALQEWLRISMGGKLLAALALEATIYNSLCLAGCSVVQVFQNAKAEIICMAAFKYSSTEQAYMYFLHGLSCKQLYQWIGQAVSTFVTGESCQQFYPWLGPAWSSRLCNAYHLILCRLRAQTLDNAAMHRVLHVLISMARDASIFPWKL